MCPGTPSCAPLDARKVRVSGFGSIGLRASGFGVYRASGSECQGLAPRTGD